MQRRGDASMMSLDVQATHHQLPPPPPRLPASSCPLHPDEHVTGFCASCLRERLAGLDTSSSSTTTTARKSTSSAFKSLFYKAAGGGGGGAQPTSSSFLRPELRRCKSFSCGRGDGLSGPRASAAFEPQRKSCDVRVRNTLWSLFHQDDNERDKQGVRDPSLPSSSSAAAAAGGEIEAECRNLVFPPPSSVTAPVLETREEDEEEEREEERDNVEDIKIVDPVLVMGTSGEIEGEEQVEAELKPMKDHIDLDSAAQAKKLPPKDLKEIAGSFWLAASVFSKKLQKWRRKQKLKKQGKAAAMPPEKPPKSSRRFRDTQSEIAVDAFGRRSCDTDPRFSLDAGRMSLDAGRMSLDDPRFSWDEPRASWDGYLIGGRSVFPRLPPMLSVVEDAPAPAPAVQRSDSQIPVEDDAVTPGGSTQTRDYYSDTSSRRRRSFERSNSVRKQVVEINEPKLASNAKVSPAGSSEFFPFHPGSLLDRDLRDLSSNSLRDDRSESFESAYRDSCKGSATKKSKRWSKAWNIWGFIHRRGSSKGGANVVERSFSESWPELRAGGYSGKILRSNSSVSSRSSFNGNGGFGSMRRSGVETNGHGKKRREEFVLERNRSARYSPSHFDNGLLRFYLTPMRSSSRRNGGSGKGGHMSSHSFTRRMLRLY
ncbi:protein OCTOPUS-like [Phoenix dactylifera]|uniref:Protein OCTOPUS-like n=1 Tax=Phoenix dactylifera TaxID=42345 RepID=A0A8B9A5E8_PHODC|nr:protein OCTOPUS-like [Phoenix dactylifera]